MSMRWCAALRPVVRWRKMCSPLLGENIDLTASAKRFRGQCYALAHPVVVTAHLSMHVHVPDIASICGPGQSSITCIAQSPNYRGKKGRAKGGIPTPALKLRGASRGDGSMGLTLYDHSPGNNTWAKSWVRTSPGFQRHSPSWQDVSPQATTARARLNHGKKKLQDKMRLGSRRRSPGGDESPISNYADDVPPLW